VFGFIQRSGDKDAESRFAMENADKLKAMDEEAYDVIASVTGSVELEETKERYREEGGKINMCEAIRGMIEDGRMEGRKEKAYQTAKNMYARGFSAQDTSALLEESLETVEEWFKSWGTGG